ncbi:MAG TPA: VOC family protein [Acidiferrobacteraceae bacterium]|nr:VOC family protein [Acidiferrobacteraceae bacterium]
MSTGGLRLWHAALRVIDLEACEAFYTHVLEMHVEWRPDPDNVYLTGGRDNLALHRVAARTADGALDHLGFIVDRPEDVDTWHETLKRHGVRIVAAPKTHRDGARSLYCRDPDGNLLQILCHPPLVDKLTS